MASTNEDAELERLDQGITQALLAIDSNFVQAAEIATSMLGDARTFTANVKATHAGIQVRGRVLVVATTSVLTAACAVAPAVEAFLHWPRLPNCSHQEPGMDPACFVCGTTILQVA